MCAVFRSLAGLQFGVNTPLFSSYRNVSVQFLRTFISVSCMTLIQWLMFSASAHTTQFILAQADSNGSYRQNRGKRFGSIN